MAMALTGVRRAIGLAGGLAYASYAGLAMAAENLPLLRVDPALLGGVAIKPAALATVPATTATKPVASSIQPVQPTNGTVGTAQVNPVAPVPVATPLTTPVEPRTAPPGTATPEAGGIASGSSAQVVATQTQPPEVGEQPSLPPLYSAHVAAGAIPHPATTPFSATDKKSAPTNIFANSIDGLNDVEMVASGDAMLERAGDSLSADRIVYRQTEDEVDATGNVRLKSPDALITGPRLRMRLEESTGEFESPEYTIHRQPPPTPEPALTMSGLPAITEGGQVLATTGRMLEREPIVGSGKSDRLEFLGADHYQLANATYSTCAPDKRDWEVSVKDLDLDYAGEVGTARDAVVRFMDVPMMYFPWMTFPLGEKRKSGFLAPTIGSTTKSGLNVSLPWYWNIAPNMDATITPRLMSKRGTQLNTELRYLDYTYTGQARVEYLPSDQLAKRDRYGYALQHTHNLGHGFSGTLNLNGVSDDNYFSDLSTRVSEVSQGNLLRQGTLSYGGPWYGATVNVQTYQTLQGLAEPYRRLPQVTGTANRYDLPLGMAFNLNAEYVNFDHPTNTLGKRTTLYPQLSLPLSTAAFWITPKIGLHSTRYQLERQTAGVPDQLSREVPIFTTDGGMVFERTADWFGQSLLQTLEPRAYYLYVPMRNQANIPVFDTAAAGFNYSQMFSENRYAGGDRIGDANQLTLAVTSRLIDPVTGEEYLRGTLGHLQYFTTQYVTLPGETARTRRSADLLAALTGKVMDKTYADFAWQYNPRDSRTERLTVGGRYRPDAGRIVNASYRYARDQLGQIDVSGQWPLSGGWHGVGRFNYSTKERRVIETIGGLEFNAGCWIGRVVVQRLATIADRPTSSLFFQLELNDFSRIGSNPLDLLKRSIPGYGMINQPTADPVFGAQ